MTYTISKLKTKTPIITDHKVIGYSNGYAFIDKYGHCFIIVYGESKRDFLINKLK